MALVPKDWETAVAPKGLRTGVVTEDWSTACCTVEGTPEYGGIVLAGRRNKRVKWALKSKKDIVLCITFIKTTVTLFLKIFWKAKQHYDDPQGKHHWIEELKIWFSQLL